MTNYQAVAAQLVEACMKAGRSPADVQLMAVTKTVPVPRILQAIADGATLLGENRVQELAEKRPQLASLLKGGCPQGRGACGMHMIGHLQSNKVSKAVQHADMIQSVDSLKIAREISKACVKQNKNMPVLVEVNMGRDPNKHGFFAEQVHEALHEISTLPGLQVQGMMTIPPVFDKKSETAQVFLQMYQLFVDMRGKKMDNISMSILSMGMSDDFELAVAHGSTLVRVGSAIFGNRY
ncbi:MAG: YggS family pyridoxal phosphate-dependent enzyme [Oscillospiraceae bacterium]|nr:YggS family pyridoxal phosphate-dependent enzyme [Oscillospiraceae bacterium]